MGDTDLLKETPSQTAGPYIHIGCLPNDAEVAGVFAEDLGSVMRTSSTIGEPITIKGCVWDGAGAPLTDAMIEVWQADANGLYSGNDPRGSSDPNFTGWGRTVSDPETGEWTFETIKPGPAASADGGTQAPHVTFWVVARGINLGLHTRMYFDDEDNSVDPVLTQLEPQNRLVTLIATNEGDATYRFDIRLQGEGETIFFDV